MRKINSSLLLACIVFGLGAWFDVQAQTEIEVGTLNAPFATGYVTPANVKGSGDMNTIGNAHNRGFVTYDLSLLPAGAQIQSAVAYFTVSGSSTSLTTTGQGVGRQLLNNTVLRAPDFNEIAQAPIWVENMDWSMNAFVPFAGTFNAAGLKAIQDRVGSWLAIGIHPPSTTNNQRTIKGYNASGAQNIPPKIRITYTMGGDTKPICEFTVTKRDPYAKDVVTFMDNSGNHPTSWSWDFGDGTTSTQKTPSKSYDSAGNYTVKLTVTNSSGSTTTTKTNYMNVKPRPPAPIANFSGSPKYITAPDTVFFKDSSLNQVDNWFWDFGDGTTSTQANPWHIYYMPSVYTVKLRVSSVWGTDSMIRDKYIVAIGGGGQPPKASFTTTGEYMRLNCTDGSTGNPESWYWDFDALANPGLHTSTLKNPTHFYTEAGTYLVCLTSSNSFGQDSSCKSVVTKVPPAPKADFTAEGTGALEVQFTDVSENEPSQWNWDLGDGNTSTLEHPKHTYASPGARSVCLTVYNISGNSFKCKQVNVYPVGLENLNKSGLRIWPNPTQGAIYVQWDGSVSVSGPISLKLRDLNGRLLKQGHLDLNQLGGTLDPAMDVHGLESGLYILEIYKDLTLSHPILVEVQ